MKQIPLLQGKALLIEMPKGAINPHIHPNSNGLWYKYEGDKGGFSYKRCDLPPGKWRIIGMLSEVTEEQADGVVESDNEYGVVMYRNYKTAAMPYYDEQITALESLESAILAEGYRFDSEPEPKPTSYERTVSNFGRNTDWKAYDKAHAKWQSAQSRVLDHSRCLLLGREDK